jgi:hypothetical protein
MLPYSFSDDYEPMEIQGIEDLIFEYEKDRDFESEIVPFLNLTDH